MTAKVSEENEPGDARSAPVDVVVLGGGLAGCLAALDARARGATVTLVAEGDGASGLSAGPWDAAGSASLGLTDTRDLSSLASEACSDPSATLLRVRELVPQLVCFHREGPLPLLVSELGVLRRAAAHDPAQLDLSRSPRAKVAVGSLSGHPSFSAREVARTLDRQSLLEGDGRRFTAVEFDFVRRGRDRVLHPHELAAVLDLDPTDARRGRDARYVLTEAIRSAVGGFPFDAVLLPPILGLHSDDVRSELEAALGLPIGEAVGFLPGAAGMRLTRRLADALRRAEVEVRRARIKRLRRAPWGLDVELEGAPLRLREPASAPRPIAAATAIVATGKLLGGGIAVTSEGGQRETLLGAALFTEGKRVGAESAADDRTGLALDERGRIRGLPGALEGLPIYAAGSVCAGFDAARSGLVPVAASALFASRAAYGGSA